MGCCICTGDFGEQEWKVWRQHPILQQYEVIKDLGDGAFSSVVLARDRTEKSKHVALKVVFLQAPEVVDDPELLSLLRSEWQLLQMLDHPNVVRCFDCRENKAQQVLVLEWLRGGPLLDSLAEVQPCYTAQHAAGIFRQIAMGLHHMHKRGVLHRDVKPENCLFAESPGTAMKEGRTPALKIIDLGMACLYRPNHPVRGPLGSPGFVAPEIVADGPHTPAMDVWSAGVILFILLVGRKPFNLKESSSLRYAYQPLLSAPGLQAPQWLALPQAVQELVLGMLQYDPVLRSTMEQVLQHPWLASSASLDDVALHDVARSAAQVGEVRRLRHDTRGVHALMPEAPAEGSQRGADAARKLYLAKRKAQIEAEKASRGVREEGSVRGLKGVERLALALARASQTRLHDASKARGAATPDLSFHYRPYVDRSQHGPPLLQAQASSMHGGPGRLALSHTRRPLNVSKSTPCLNGLEDAWEAGSPREPSLATAIKGSFVDLLASAPLDSSVRLGNLNLVKISLGITKDRSQHGALRDRADRSQHRSRAEPAVASLLSSGPQDTASQSSSFEASLHSGKRDVDGASSGSLQNAPHGIHTCGPLVGPPGDQGPPFMLHDPPGSRTNGKQEADGLRAVANGHCSALQSQSERRSEEAGGKLAGGDCTAVPGEAGGDGKRRTGENTTGEVPVNGRRLQAKEACGSGTLVAGGSGEHGEGRQHGEGRHHGGSACYRELMASP